MHTLSVVLCNTLAASLLLVSSLALAAADTLVIKGKDGSYQPGAAKSFKASEQSITFVLADGVDGNAVLKTLTERLATGKVSLAGNELTVSGMPKDTLLDQLSTLSLSGNVDPLADLAGLGGAVTAMNSPEGGGSIRASKPSSTSMRPNVIKDHDPSERYEAEVLEVKQGSFPTVTLKLKIRKTAKAGALKSKLKLFKVVEAQVAYTVIDSSVDMNRAENRRNLVGWFLTKGDKISIHPTEASADKYEIDWLARQE